MRAAAYCSAGFLPHAGSRRRLHLPSPGDQCTDVDTRRSQRQQPHGGQDGITPPHIVRDNEGRIPLPVGQSFQSSSGTVRHRDDALPRPGLSVTSFELAAKDTEGYRRFGGRPRLGDDDYPDRTPLQGFQQIIQIIFADILSGKDHIRPRTFPPQTGERIAERFEHRPCTEIRTAYAYHDNHIRHGTQLFRRILHPAQLRLRHRRGQRNPPQKIGTGAGTLFQHPVALPGTPAERFDGGNRNTGRRHSIIEPQHIITLYMSVPIRCRFRMPLRPCGPNDGAKQMPPTGNGSRPRTSRKRPAYALQFNVYLPQSDQISTRCRIFPPGRIQISLYSVAFRKWNGYICNMQPNVSPPVFL